MGSIYCIENLVNGKKYIGSTTRTTKERWNEHISELNANRHSNPHLQNGWNKYKSESFKFYVLETEILDNQLKKKESEWIARFDTLSKNLGYNLREELENGSYKHSQETKDKISIGVTNKKEEISEKLSKSWTDERKKLQSRIASERFSGDKNPSKRLDVKQKQSEAWTTERKETMSRSVSGDNAPMRRNPDTVRKVSHANSKRRYILITPNGSIYAVKNMTAFCKNFQLTQGSMDSVVRGIRKHYKGYTARYMTDDEIDKYEIQLKEDFWRQIE